MASGGRPGGHGPGSGSLPPRHDYGPEEPALGGLAPVDVAVTENGSARDVVSLSPDHRPLTVAVLVDTSPNMGSTLRFNVMEPLLSFLSGLPPDSKYALWTTGDRPMKVVDYTADVSMASRALNRVSPRGRNALLDALVEASADLEKQKGKRSAVVTVTKVGIELGSRDFSRVVDEASAKAPLFMALEIDEGMKSFESGTKESEESFRSTPPYGYVLSQLAKKTGGVYERVLSSTAISLAFQRVVAPLRAQYQLRYLTLPEIQHRRLDVKVSLPGARVRIRPANADSLDE